MRARRGVRGNEYDCFFASSAGTDPKSTLMHSERVSQPVNKTNGTLDYRGTSCTHHQDAKGELQWSSVCQSSCLLHLFMQPLYCTLPRSLNTLDTFNALVSLPHLPSLYSLSLPLTFLSLSRKLPNSAPHQQRHLPSLSPTNLPY